MPGAELPPLLPLSTRTSLAAAQEPPAACPHEERPCADGGIAAGLRLGTVENGDAAAGLRGSGRMGLLPLMPIPWSAPELKSGARQMPVIAAGSSQARSWGSCSLSQSDLLLGEESAPARPGSEQEDALRGAHGRCLVC